MLLILGLVALNATGQDLRDLNYHHYDSWNGEQKINFLRGLVLGSVLMEDVFYELGHYDEGQLSGNYGPAGITLGEIHGWFVEFYEKNDWSTPLFVPWVDLLKRIGGTQL